MNSKKSDKKKVSIKKDNWEEKAGEYLAGWQRAKADYENLQKDLARQKAEYVNFANSNLIMELLPVYDNFKIAFKSIPEDQKNNGWVVGFEHIKNQLWKLLENNGIEEIKAVGEIFNPEKHEAMESVNDDKYKDDEIVKEIKAGYLWNGKVIQATKVVVCKKSDKKNK